VIPIKIVDLSPTEYLVSDVYIENLLQQRYCVFDLEATGPDPESDHITQIGAVTLDAQGNVGDQFNTLVRSPKPIPEKIEKLTGIRNQDLTNAPDFSEAYDHFTRFSQSCVLVTQAGYEYDIPLLVKVCERHRLPLNEYLTIDMKALFTYLYPDVTEVVSTKFLIRFFDIYADDLQRHDALGDSILIARIFQKLLDVCRNRGMKHLSIEGLRVKKVQLQPLD
jgi:DNA polymerase III epsilon subunit-like protein